LLSACKEHFATISINSGGNTSKKLITGHLPSLFKKQMGQHAGELWILNTCQAHPGKEDLNYALIRVLGVSGFAQHRWLLTAQTIIYFC